MRTSASAPQLARHDPLGAIGAAMLCTLIVLMIVPEGFDYSQLLTGRNPDAGGPLSRALWLGLFVSSALISVSRMTFFRLTVRRLNPFLLLFLALAVASIAWSIEPVITLRRDFRLATIVLVCIAFTLTGWHPRRVQSVVRPMLTIMMVGSIIFGIVAPALAIHQDTAPELAGAWRGLTNHKNSLGALAGVTFLFWFQAWSAREVRTLYALIFSIVAGICVWLSRSATSLVATIFAAAFLMLLTRWPRGMQPYLKYAIGIVVVALTLYTLTMLRVLPGQGVLLSPLTSLIGFDITYTGRSEIWTIIGDSIAKHPILGVGYGAYWTGPDPHSPSYEFVARMRGFYPGSAHNGYLEIANDLGWTGLLLLFGYFAQHLRQIMRYFIFDRPQAALYLTLFMQQAIANLSESHWLSVLSVHFVLMTLVTAALARHLLAVHLEMRSAQQQAAATANARAWQLQERRA